MAIDATASGGAVGLSLPAVGMGVNRPPRGARGTKDTPIVLDDDYDDSIEELELKPAAAGVGVPAAAAVAAVVAASESPPADFTCAICLDAPSCMSEVASIGGCTHRFCFDCIDRWAETENRCPCCKTRFRTIDRVVALPPSPAETQEAAGGGEGGGGGRRGKRKRERRGSSPNARGSRRGGNASSDRRVNSRVVEERSQQSATAFMIDAYVVQHILSSFINPQGEGGLFGGNNQVTFVISEDGRPQIRVMGNGRTMGIMELYLSGGGVAHASSGGAGNNPSEARVRISRAHRRSPISGSETGASVVANGDGDAPTNTRLTSAGLPPSETRLMELRSTINLANGSSMRSAAADSTGGGASPSSAVGGGAGGNQQVSSSLASFFSSLIASPPGGGVSAGSRSVPGAAAVASSARGARISSGPSNRMTIRFVTRPAAANRGELSGVDRDDLSRSTNPSASGGSDDEGPGRGGSDEPIVID